MRAHERTRMIEQARAIADVIGSARGLDSCMAVYGHAYELYGYPEDDPPRQQVTAYIVRPAGLRFRRATLPKPHMRVNVLRWRRQERSYRRRSEMMAALLLGMTGAGKGEVN